MPACLYCSHAGCRVQTYYGNPLCCTWSPDGQYVAAGGEDDLVAVFGMEEQRVVAWGEGHGSWVSAVSFDPWCAPGRTPLLTFNLKSILN